MLEAQDTVIDLTDMGNYSLKIAMTSILKQQAEITWDKAIRLVVEWGNEDCPHLWVDDNGVPITHSKHECSQCWQSKEWGIDG